MERSRFLFRQDADRADPALEEALAANSAAGLPSIDVSAPQGKLIHLLARMSGARKALEIGTLGGYSTIWLARALPDDGRLITLEVSAKHAEVARRNVARAGLGDKVEIRTGAALERCPRSRPRGSARSTSSSSTPTRPTTRPISNGRCAFPGREPRSWSTMWCGRARWSTRRPRAGRRRRAPHVRLDGARAALERDRDPDRRREGLGRLRARHCELRTPRRRAECSRAR